LFKKIPYPIKYFEFGQNHDFILESGQAFGPVQVAYETFGTLNQNKDNAILVIHALTGDTHVTSGDDPDKNTPGWWDTLFGPGNLIDTDRYFVICANCLGGCMGTTGPASVDPKTGKPYGLSFPIFSIQDMVEIQKQLIDHLEIQKLHAVIGGSIGGMQVLEWAVRYPDRMNQSIIIASAHKTSPQIIGFGEVQRNSIMADPNFNSGNYYDGTPPEKGLSIARMAAHITYLSRDSMESKFGRDIKTELKEGDELYGLFGPMFQVESYLRYQGRKFVQRFDANSYLYLTKAMDLYDLTRGKNQLKDLVARIQSKILVISFDSDWHFRPIESWEIVKAMMNMGKPVSYVNISTPYGHDAFLMRNDEMEKIISNFINYREAN
jgi:homoserine O-acetyltransferase